MTADMPFLKLAVVYLGDDLFTKNDFWAAGPRSNCSDYCHGMRKVAK